MPKYNPNNLEQSILIEDNSQFLIAQKYAELLAYQQRFLQFQVKLAVLKTPELLPVQSSLNKSANLSGASIQTQRQLTSIRNYPKIVMMASDNENERESSDSESDRESGGSGEGEGSNSTEQFWENFFGGSDNNSSYESSSDYEGWSETEKQEVAEEYNSAEEGGWDSGPGEWFAEREAASEIQEWKQTESEKYTETENDYSPSSNQESNETEQSWETVINPETGESFENQWEFTLFQITSETPFEVKEDNSMWGERGNLFEAQASELSAKLAERLNMEDKDGKPYSRIRELAEGIMEQSGGDNYNGSQNGQSEVAISQYTQAVEQMRAEIRAEVVAEIQEATFDKFESQRTEIAKEFEAKQEVLSQELTARQCFVQQHGQPISQMDHQTLMEVRGDLKESLATIEFQPDSKLQQRFETQLNLVEKELEFEIAIENLETQKQSIVDHHQNKTINNHVQFAGNAQGPYGGDTYRTPTPGTDSDTDYSPDNNPAAMGFESWEQYREALTEIDNEIGELEDIIDTNQAAKVEKEYQDKEKMENGEFVETEFTKLKKEIAELRTEYKNEVAELKQEVLAEIRESVEKEAEAIVQEKMITIEDIRADVMAEMALKNESELTQEAESNEVVTLEDIRAEVMAEMALEIENEQNELEDDGQDNEEVEESAEDMIRRMREEVMAELDLEDVIEDNKIELENIRVEKSGDYVKNFVAQFENLSEDEREEFERLTGVELRLIEDGEKTLADYGLDVNHRIPPNILSENEKIKILDTLGLSDINAPPLMDLLILQANRGQHQAQWRSQTRLMREFNNVNGNDTELSTDQILNIWSKIEKAIPYKYELPNSINPNDYI